MKNCFTGSSPHVSGPNQLSTAHAGPGPACIHHRVSHHLVNALSAQRPSPPIAAGGRHPTWDGRGSPLPFCHPLLRPCHSALLSLHRAEAPPSPPMTPSQALLWPSLPPQAAQCRRPSPVHLRPRNHLEEHRTTPLINYDP
jgi:hypothetical protein